MRRILLAAVTGGSLLLATGASFSQTVIELSPEEETTFYTTVTRERGPAINLPAGFTVSVGAELPREVEIREVPSTIKVESARRYRYAVVEDRVVLVDPGTRKIVRVISKR